MICITGVPGSGKSTIREHLKLLGLNCINVLELDGATDCLEHGEMDIDCLRDRIDSAPVLEDLIVEGHYAHLLKCSLAFVIERDEVQVRNVLLERGYSEGKIDENIDALRSDTIYQETLELLPAARIHRINVVENHPGDAAVKIMKIIDYAKKN